MNTDPSRNPPANQQPDAGTPDAGQTAKQAASEPGPLGGGDGAVESPSPRPGSERAEGAGGVMVSIESGHDPRLYSGFYASPLKVFVGDRCVWDSELPTPAAWYEDASLETWFPLTAETLKAAVARAEEATQEKIAWAADALNCHQAIEALLKFHPESAETGAELPPECWTPEYRRAVEYAKRCLPAGWAAAAGSGDTLRSNLESPAPSGAADVPEGPDE